MPRSRPPARIARDLIRFPTVNYGMGKSEGERPAAEYIAAELESLGLTPQLFESEPGRTSLVARVEGADPARPAMVLHGHLARGPGERGTTGASTRSAARSATACCGDVAPST